MKELFQVDYEKEKLNKSLNSPKKRKEINLSKLKNQHEFININEAN
jgi:hypothetical protein